jgi:hypothetical protein
MKHRLRIRHDGLDLDDKEARGPLVPRQYVERAALAPDRERNLDRDLPVRITKQRDGGIDESSVGLVEEAVEAFPVPSKPHVNLRPKGRGYSAQHANRHLVDQTALDLGDHASGYVREPGYVFLSKPTPNAKRPKPATKNDIHRAESAKKGSSAGARALHADFTPHLPANNPPRRVRSAR